MLRLRRLGVLLAAAVTTVALGGCGTTGGGQGGQQAPPDPNAILNWGVDWSSGATHLDPLGQWNGIKTAPAAAWQNLIYDTMIRQTPQGLQPGLATAWDSPGNSTVVLTLRKGVTFQDGTALDADAVKYAWDRLIGVKSYAASYGAMKTVQAVSPDTVRVTLTAPTAYLFINQYLTQAYNGLGVPSPKALKDAGCAPTGDACPAYEKAPVGAGPMAFDSAVAGKEVKLRKFAGYWSANDYQFSGINFVQTAKGTATTIALRSGTIDGAYVSPSDAKAFSSNRDFQVVRQPGDSTVVLSLCATKGPLQSREARQALAKAIDPQVINQAVYAGAAVPTRFPLPSGIDVAPAASNLDFDVAAAKRLVEQSGQQGATITILASNVEAQAVNIATILQSQWQAIGFNVVVRPSTNPSVENPQLKPEVYLTNGTPFTALQFILPKTGSANACQNNFPGIQQAMSAATNVSAGEQAVKEGWQQLQQAVFADVPALWFVALPNIQVTSNHITGLKYLDPSNQTQTVDWRGVGKSS